MTVGQTPPGWYDDGRGQLRYYDGSAWTEHVQPLPQAAPPPPPAPPAQPAAPAAPVAAPVAAAPVAAAGTAAATGAYATESTQTVAPVAAATPIYKKPWFIIVVILAVLALAAAAFLLSSGDDDDAATGGTPTASTPAATNGTGTGAGTSFYGQDASVVATKANCTPGATLPVSTTPPVQGAAPKSLSTCTLNGTSYTIATWTTAADQANTASLSNAFTQPIAAGTKYYATGDGWTAFDPTYSQASAQAFATAAGGTVKSVVVVTAPASSAPQ